MTTLLSERKASLETRLSHVAGVPVEITFIGGAQISVAAEGDARAALEKIHAFLGGDVTDWSAVFDPSCDYSCAYLTLKGF